MIEFKKQEKAEYEKTDAPRITESREYVAEVVKVEEFQSKSHPDWAPSIKFIFRVLEEPFVGGFASGLVTSIWTPGNKLDRWLTALGVSGANVGDKLSSDQLKKSIVRATVTIKDSFANVTDLQPMAERDFKRVSPDAHKKSAPKSTLTSTAATPAPAAAPQVAPAAASTNIAVTNVPSSTPAPAAEVTKDDTIPF